MSLAAAMLIGSAACGGAEAPGSLLARWGETSLVGLHSHAVGADGRAIAREEKAHDKRRRGVAMRLAALCGREAVVRVDDEALEAAQGVYWVRGPTDGEEWKRLSRARRALGKLARRIAQEERR